MSLSSISLLLIVTSIAASQTHEVDVAQAQPNSEVTSAAPVRDLKPGEFGFVVELGGPHLVLATEVQDRWLGGPLRVELPGRVVADVDATARPSQWAGVIGKEFDVYDEEGNRCTGVLGKPRIVSEFYGERAGDLDMFEAWERFEHAQSRVDAQEDSELADAVWQHGRRLVVAAIDDCDDGVWARMSSLPAPRVLKPDDMPSDVLEEELPWAWQDPAVVDWSRTFAAHKAAIGEEERADLSDVIVGARWRDDQGIGLVSFHLEDPDEYGCGDPSNRVWGAVDEGERRKVPGVAGGGPQAVFDLDGDGTLELLIFDAIRGARTLGTSSSNGVDVTLRLPAAPFDGCHC